MKIQNKIKINKIQQTLVNEWKFKVVYSFFKRSKNPKNLNVKPKVYQQTLTCSKSTIEHNIIQEVVCNLPNIETLEKGMKYVQS